MNDTLLWSRQKSGKLLLLVVISTGKNRQNGLKYLFLVSSVLTLRFRLVRSRIQLRVESWWAKPRSGHDQSELHQPPQSFQNISTISV